MHQKETQSMATITPHQLSISTKQKTVLLFNQATTNHVKCRKSQPQFRSVETQISLLKGEYGELTVCLPMH